MTRRKSICVVKICTPREAHGGVMGRRAVNAFPPVDILCRDLQGGSAEKLMNLEFLKDRAW